MNISIFFKWNLHNLTLLALQTEMNEYLDLLFQINISVHVDGATVCVIHVGGDITQAVVESNTAY